MTGDVGHPTVEKMTESPVRLNSDCDWNTFGAQEYYENNYRRMRGDDQAMLAATRDWFRKAAGPGGGLDAVDVGCGSNLYPAFTLLPHSHRVTLYEYSDASVEWLKAAVRELPDSWRPFAELACPGEHFATIRTQAAGRFEVHKGSIFDLPPDRWDIGTMFFVAESLTADKKEFRAALDRFLRALRPGAPFAAAFMERSRGYKVGRVRYPAVQLDQAGLRGALEDSGRVVDPVAVHRFDIDPEPIRPGYTGYLLATGKVKG